MNDMTFSDYAGLYRDNLLLDVLPFWNKYSHDREFGGYFTCLERDGKIYDKDKFIWLQCRQVWTYSSLYNQVEQNEEWLQFAIQGAEFLKKYGRDEAGDWYFSLTREGRPLVQAYNIFSDCFAAMAFGQLYKATGNAEYRIIALDTFNRILERKDSPKGRYSKIYPGTRPLKSLSLPMILSNLVLEMESILEPSEVESVVQYCIDTVLGSFFHEESGLMLENVKTNGGFSDSFEGRLVMPGHSLESMWFLMDIAKRKGDKKLIRKATDIALNLLDFGWDKKFGGVFYMMDIFGHPPQQLEWDQKLWWVHLEAIVCMLKGYYHTGDERCLAWFKKLHDYTWGHFPDQKYGEWFGYLNRQGEILLTLKGGKWKGCFHVPRCLYQGWQTMLLLSEKYEIQPENK